VGRDREKLMGTFPIRTLEQNSGTHPFKGGTVVKESI